MTMMETLRNDMIEARKGTDSVRKNLLITLFSESQMVGKNKGNRETTDDEALTTIKKFVGNTEETLRFMAERNVDSSSQQHELAILQSYLPHQLTEAELTLAIAAIVATLPERSAKAMGAVMAQLKAQYGVNYDGKQASALVKSALL